MPKAIRHCQDARSEDGQRLAYRLLSETTMPPVIHAIATMDSKGVELDFLARTARAAGASVVTVDVGTKDAPQLAPDISRETVADCHPGGRAAVLGCSDRGAAISAMGEALTVFMRRRQEAGLVSGAVGLGGTGGTALIAPALRALPIGVPKLLVSTVASGNTAPYVGTSDLVLMPAVVDVAGLNRVSRRVLGNAAHAISGMVGQAVQAASGKPTVGLTMFGVTTPCVNRVRAQLEEAGYECLVFHATGTGGATMEQLVADGLIGAVIDITTTEVADEVVGGIFPAGPRRFEAIFSAGIPYVMSLGALDMVNFGARATVPERFAGRRLHVHNPQITLMRTTPDENRACARWMAAKINRSTAPVTLLMPERSTSALSAAGAPFHDPAADRALFDELERLVVPTPTRRLVRLPLDLNDPAFADALVAAFTAVAASSNTLHFGTGRQP
jgi:uncharacterized protein (UPF0261 family)